jgi:transposase InsO family protein
LLELICADLKSSPFSGEGHRKVWARLRVRDGARVARKRVLRLMRENHLLLPFRSQPKPLKGHDGKIITLAPKLMGGTDGTRVFTAEEGWVWIFVAVDHWNAECGGWHVCKTGDRYAALQPISMGPNALYGGLQAGVARGLALRMDHGTQYLSDHFLNQVKFWGASSASPSSRNPRPTG